MRAVVNGALLVALVWALVHVWPPAPLRVHHAAFYHAACLCPVCLVVPSARGAGFGELSVGEYC